MADHSLIGSREPCAACGFDCPDTEQEMIDGRWCCGACADVLRPKPSFRIFDDKGNDVADRIRDAVLKEREACAKLAEDGGAQPDPEWRLADTVRFGNAVAAAIRARGAG